MAPRKCCLKRCGSVGLRCFSLPLDEKFKKLWLQWILEVNGEVKKNVLVCEKHFNKNDMGLKKLKKGAVPCFIQPNECDAELGDMIYNDCLLDHNDPISSIIEIDVCKAAETSILCCDSYVDKVNYTAVVSVEVAKHVEFESGHEVCDEFAELNSVDFTSAVHVEDCNVQDLSGVTGACPVEVGSELSTTERGEKLRIQRRCCVNGCLNNNTTMTMYAFPRVDRIINGDHVFDDRSLHRCQQWILFCQNEKLSSKSVSVLHKHFYVCASHFSIDAFNGKQLKKNAIPCFFGLEPLHSVRNDIPCNSNDAGCSDIISARGAHSSRLLDLKSMRSRKLSQKFEDLMKSCVMSFCPTCKEKYMYYPGLKKAHRGRNLCWKFSSQNNMDPGEVPVELKELTFIEEQLIARVHPILCVYKLKGSQYGYKGNTINFSQDVGEFANKLPHRVDDLCSVLTVRFENNRTEICDFQVRAKKVHDALLWLIENNPYYYNIEISSENLEELPEDRNMFDRVSSMVLNIEGEDEDCAGSEAEGDLDAWKVTSSGVPYGNFATQNDQITSVLSWPELSQEPVSEYLPGLIVCAFPTLYPYGNCDLKDQREKEIKMHEYLKHMLLFADGRFAQHKTFRFFGFNMWMRHTALMNGNVFVKMDNDLSRMNIGQLKERIEEDPSLLNKLMFMGTNIRGSKSFWKSRCGELKDMVEQLGLPTIFLTMSSADMYWPDLFRLLSDKDVSQLSMRERRVLVQENPLIVDTFFQYRLECFLENVLIPKYGIVDYWYRVEYQHRGSPHIHGLFWLKNAPDMSKYVEGNEGEKKKIVDYFNELVCAVIPEENVCEVEQHCCETLLQDVQDVEIDLSHLVKTVQMHKCSKGYCQRIDKKTKQPFCRFHFPMNISPCAKIEMNSFSDEFEFIPERNHDKVNKFNPFIIASWRANIDIAPVVSKKAIIQYLSKYVSKSEIRSTSLQEICSAVCGSLSSDDKAKRAVHKILMKNCVERDISAQEVCHLMMGIKLYSCGGRGFVVVYTNSSKWVPVSVSEENNAESSVIEDGCRGKSFMQKYSERPAHLHQLSMWDVAKYYNRKWSQVKKPNIVRVFPRLKVSADEEKMKISLGKKFYCLE